MTRLVCVLLASWLALGCCTARAPTARWQTVPGPPQVVVLTRWEDPERELASGVPRIQCVLEAGARSWAGVTGDDGFLCFALPGPGRYRFTALADGLELVEELVLGSGEAANVDCDLTAWVHGEPGWEARTSPGEVARWALLGTAVVILGAVALALPFAAWFGLQLLARASSSWS